MKKYTERLVDHLLLDRLQYMGAVVLEGARATGKTMTGSHHSKSVARVDLELSAQPMLADNPELLLAGAAPRLLDEWQMLPALWNLVRHEVDQRSETGQFILTGSAIPEDDATRHSGAGRFSRLRMRPFSTSESHPAETPIHLHELLQGNAHIQGVSTLDFTTLLSRMTSGGWPAVQGRISGAERWVRSYVEEITRIDVARIGVTTKRRDPEKILRVMMSLARNIGSALRISTIIQDAAGPEGALAHETVVGYLEALRRVFILEELPAWRPHLRSSTELRTTPKFYFVDPSIGPATLRLSAARMSNDLEYVGQVFENLVIRDLLIYSEACGARMSYYRDNSGLEVDVIIEGDDAAWIAIEIKLGQRNLDAAAMSLLRFSEKIDTRKSGQPNALIIITSGGYAFTRSDGVHVVPIDLLTV